VSDGPRCDKCRHWESERMRGVPNPHGGLEWQARCLEDRSLAAPPLRWCWDVCPKFAPELRPYPKEAA
jgi:hypothetical protein